MNEPTKRPKRPLHPDELRFILFGNDASKAHVMKPNTNLHLMRKTVNGRALAACTYGSIQLHLKRPFYEFPCLQWFTFAAPVCPICREVAESVFTPVSNTGVNYPEGANHDAK